MADFRVGVFDEIPSMITGTLASTNIDADMVLKTIDYTITVGEGDSIRKFLLVGDEGRFLGVVAVTGKGQRFTAKPQLLPAERQFIVEEVIPKLNLHED